MRVATEVGTGGVWGKVDAKYEKGTRLGRLRARSANRSREFRLEVLFSVFTFHTDVTVEGSCPVYVRHCRILRSEGTPSEGGPGGHTGSPVRVPVGGRPKRRETK